MSRIGLKPIEISENVQVSCDKEILNIKGEHGQQSLVIPKNIVCEIVKNEIFVKRLNDERDTKALHGTFRAHIQNAIIGVSELFKKQLEIYGTGYKAEMQKDMLILSLGFSHKVNIKPILGVEITCQGNNKIVVSGMNKQLVGEQAAIIRNLKKPDPYKGNGIRYTGEHISLREGKKAATTTGKK